MQNAIRRCKTHENQPALSSKARSGESGKAASIALPLPLRAHRSPCEGGCLPGGLQNATPPGADTASPRPATSRLMPARHPRKVPVPSPARGTCPAAIRVRPMPTGEAPCLHSAPYPLQGTVKAARPRFVVPPASPARQAKAHKKSRTCPAFSLRKDPARNAAILLRAPFPQRRFHRNGPRIRGGSG